MLRRNNTMETMSDSSMDEPIAAGDMFGMYHAELIRFLRRGTTKSMSNKVVLQLVTQPMQASWYKDSNLLNFYTMSARYGLSPAFEIRDGRPFDLGYTNFLNSLQFPTDSMSASQKAQLDNLYNEEDKLQMDLSMAEGDCLDRWQTSPASFQTFTFDQYSSKICSRFQRLDNQVKQIQGTIQSFRENFQYGGTKQFEVTRAIKQLRDVPTQSRKFIELNPLSNFVNNYNNGLMNPFKIQLTASSYSSEQSYKYSKFGLMLFIVNAAGQSKRMQLTTSKRHFEITITAASFSAIRVVPDPTWYNPEVVSAWNNGPFSSQNKDYFFGQSGEISSIVRTIYVAYRPTVELIVNRQDADEFMKSSSFGVSINIYGYNLGFNTAKGRQDINDSRNLSKITLESTSDEPQIIAFDNEILG
jgi:hypothetical protein